MQLMIHALTLAVVWLASCQTTLLLANALPTSGGQRARASLKNVSTDASSTGSFATYSTIDARGGAYVDKVFLHRFGYTIGNVTLITNLQAALGIILSSPDQLQATFTHAPRGAQLLTDPTSGSPAALRAVAISRSLAAAVSGTISTTAGSASASNTAAKAVLDRAAIHGSLTQLADQLALLSPGSCHPITRRIVLAALAQLQLRLHAQGAPPETQALHTDPETGRLLFRLYRLLFEAHRRGAAAKGAIEFLHISKSGGTSMCSVADRNGCAAESTTNFGNCMVRRFDDRPRWVSAAVHNETQPLTAWRWYGRYLVRRGERSCEYRDEFLQRARFTFYSNEFAVQGALEAPPPATPAPAGAGSANTTTPTTSAGSSRGGTPAAAPPWSSAHLCPQFLNLVMLRHPLARLLSHVRWIIKVYRTEYGRSFEPFFRGRDADHWRRFAPAAVDNYYVRLLLGEAGFYLPPEHIDETHMAAARLVLLQYDVVLLLEAPDVDSLWLRQALGWRAGLGGAKARVGEHHRYLTDLLPFDMDELEAANAEDVQLYDFGVVLHQLDGLMFEAVAAAGVEPYSRYREVERLDEADEGLGRRVRCGYVTRRKELLEGRGYNMTALVRKYDKEFPRIPAADEKGRGTRVAEDLEQDRGRKQRRRATRPAKRRL